MILFPPAKINLGLNILGKRSDNFHVLETCMLAIGLTDVLEILPSDEFSFSHSGIQINGEDENNLVVQAFELIKSNYNIANVAIHLQKNIPMGAGLGGGSADATYTLLGLNKMFDLKLSNSTLEELASELGSDCAFFVQDSAQIATGRGEILENILLDLKGMFLKIINPGIHIGTKEAYANIRFAPDDNCIEDIIQLPVSEWKDSLKNDFEVSAFREHESLSIIKGRMYTEGAVYASMTGSGSTMYSIYNERPVLWDSKLFERIIEL